MFNKILIANRGEIACRIIKTARQMGIQSIAIYSSLDENSLHVRLADSAYYIGKAAAKLSYLNIAAIITAAKQSGAEAIHPGYGFLAENPHFAEACKQAKLCFIGPSVEALEIMASKQLAKQLLAKTGVPLIPGYHGKEQNDDTLFNEAKRMGFPVLLKAASGGGGKGMRSVYHEEDFLPALAGARHEALASFADDTMIIEKLVNQPRHIEVQIMADNFGHIVHLFERDCSIQRRHQKIIEEAPAPNLAPNLRQKIVSAACEVARAIDYRGAGTVEFLVDTHDQFYFMEMNTRLQVEHPVTEMITGLDLVNWQLKIAANEPLPLPQKLISASGHAIECRIYAEDPYQKFLPSAGQINFLHEPHGEGVRLDTGIAHSSTVTTHYDPLLAKLIAWGETREQALARLKQGLNNYAIGGVKTNLPFLRAICQHSVFIESRLNTDFLNQYQLSLPKPDLDLILILAASYDYLTLVDSIQEPIFKQSFAWQMHLESYWYWHYLIESERYEVRIAPLSQSHFILTVGKEDYSLTATLDGIALRVHNEKKRWQALIDAETEQLNLHLKEGSISVQRFDGRSVAITSAKKGQLTAPMPATVIAVLKNKGDKVNQGDPLIVLEAMKMEHTIHAPYEGILTELFYEVGAQVSEGAELLALEEHKNAELPT